MRVTAVLPVKDFHNAKQRLSPLLDAPDREALAAAMFRDVLRQTLRSAALEATCVVTASEKVAALALALGARVIREPAETGETSAVEYARSELMRAHCEAVLVIPGDIPLVQANDIEQVLAQLPVSATSPWALLVPSHDRMGTNALLLAPPDIINLRFGFDSFNYHMSQLAAQRLPLRCFENAHFALDIDEPKDLWKFLSHESLECETYRLARELVGEVKATQSRMGGG